MITFLFFILYLVMPVFPFQVKRIYFQVPAITGDFYLSGNLTFSPGAVKNENSIVIAALLSGKEIPTKINIVRRWKDESVMNADIIFAASESQGNEYEIRFGGEISRKKTLKETAVLPVINFTIGGAALAEEKINMSVGTINVRVDKSSDFYYYWYLFPIAFFIGLTVYRSRKN